MSTLRESKVCSHLHEALDVMGEMSPIMAMDDMGRHSSHDGDEAHVTTHNLHEKGNVDFQVQRCLHGPA